MRYLGGKKYAERDAVITLVILKVIMNSIPICNPQRAKRKKEVLAQRHAI